MGVLRNSRRGESAVVLEAGPELCRLDVTLAPGARGPYPHLHGRQEERFEVVSGALTVRAGTAVRRLGPGDATVVAPGAVHSFANRTREEARALVEVVPGLRIHECFEALARMLAEPGIGRKIRLFVRGAALCREHDLYWAALPLALQREVGSAFAALDRRLPR